MLCVGSSYADVVTKFQAQQKALHFLQQNSNTQLRSFADDNLKLSYTKRKSANDDNGYYYVFSKENGKGYIIVSGEDRTISPILGYSDDGTFVADELPGNMKSWLDNYCIQIDYLLKNPNVEVKTSARGFATKVEPLLGNIAWSQRTPFNDNCPYDSVNKTRYPAGCVATAMAQIMYFYKWPKKGSGSHGYSWNKKTLSADFANTTYGWDKMLPNYINASASEESRKAAAQLVYHCGVSVDMDYNLNGSSAFLIDAISALYKYFGYDNGMKLLNRLYYRTSEWETIIKDELDNGRPVFYRGENENEFGHAFVCDGYNQDGYFHFNWGWSGTSNGYFLTTALDYDWYDSSTVIQGFDVAQTIIIGIQPETDSVVNDEFLYGKYFINNGSLSMKMYNMGLYDFTSSLKYELVNEKGASVFSKVLSESTNCPSGVIKHGSLLNQGILSTDDAVSLADGQYAVKVYHKLSGSGKWQRVYYSEGNSEENLVTVQCLNNKITALNYGWGKTYLKVSNLKINGKLYFKTLSSLSVQVENTGSDFSGNLRFCLYSSNSVLIAEKSLMTSILSGENKEIDFAVLFSSYKNITGPTMCALYLYYDSYKLYSKDVILYPQPESSKLVLSKDLVCKYTGGNSVQFDATLKNFGGLFYDNVSLALIHHKSDGSEEQIMQGKKTLLIDKEEEKVISFLLDDLTGIPGDKYFAKFIFPTDTTQTYKSQFEFTWGLATSVDNIKTVSPIQVYPNPATDFLNVIADSGIKEIEMFSLSGAVVYKSVHNGMLSHIMFNLSGLSPGLYILQANTNDGFRTTKIFVR